MIATRRKFIQGSMAGAMVAGFPSIVPSSVFGATAPSNRINIGAIGVGRISRVHDMPGVLKFTGVPGRDNRIVAVCDLSAKRVELGRQFVDAAIPRSWALLIPAPKVTPTTKSCSQTKILTWS